MKTTPKLPPALKSVDVEGVLRKRGFYLKQKKNQDLVEVLKPIVKQMRKQKKPKAIIEKEVENRKSAYFTNEQIEEYWQKQIHVVDVVEKQFETKLVQFIDKLGREFLKHFDDEVKSEKSFPKFVKKDYFSDHEDELLTEASISLEPLLQSLAVIAGNNANKLIGISQPYLPFNYRQQISDNVLNFTKSMLDTDRKHLANLISDGLSSGKTVNEIRSQIESDFIGKWSRMQADRISKTEIIRVSNQAALDAFEQSGVVEGKQWAAFGATDECAAYDGKIETLKDSFYGSDNEFQDGDPPLHPNCKCIVIPIVEGTKSYQSDNSALIERIKNLEDQVDKRTKEYKQVKSLQADDRAYIKALEELIDG